MGSLNSKIIANHKGSTELGSQTLPFCISRYRTGKSFLLDLLARYLKVKAAETAKVLVLGVLGMLLEANYLT